MNNVEPQITKTRTEINPTYLPLFGEDVFSRTADNADPQNDTENAQGIEGEQSEINLYENLSLEDPADDDAANVVLLNTQNVETHINQQAVESSPEEIVSAKKPPKKPARRKKKKADKKVKSQKRLVVVAKIFMIPGEKLHFELLARERGQSFSNYIRLLLELPPNKRGRARRNGVAMLDLGLDDFAEDGQ